MPGGDGVDIYELPENEDGDGEQGPLALEDAPAEGEPPAEGQGALDPPPPPAPAPGPGDAADPAEVGGEVRG